MCKNQNLWMKVGHEHPFSWTTEIRKNSCHSWNHLFFFSLHGWRLCACIWRSSHFHFGFWNITKTSGLPLESPCLLDAYAKIKLWHNIPCLWKGSSLINTHEGTFSQDTVCLLLINFIHCFLNSYNFVVLPIIPC